MGLRGGDGHPQGLRRIFARDEGRALVLDRVEEVLQFPLQWLFLSHVDLLPMVLEWNLVQVERVQRPEGARAHGHGLLDVVHLDEILEAGESELSDLHRGQPVDLDKTVDAVPETEQDVRVVLELLMDLATAEGEDALDRGTDDVPEDVDVVHPQVHDDSDIPDAARKGAHTPGRRRHQVAILAFFDLPLDDRGRRIVPLNVSHGEGEARPFRRIDDAIRLRDGRREWFLDKERDPSLDRLEGDFRVVLRRDAHAHRVEFLSQEVRRIRVVRNVEAVRRGPPAFTSGSAIPTRSAISEYTRAWFCPIAPTPMTPTRISAATGLRRRPRDINARRQFFESDGLQLFRNPTSQVRSIHIEYASSAASGRGPWRSIRCARSL